MTLPSRHSSTAFIPVGLDLYRSALSLQTPRPCPTTGITWATACVRIVRSLHWAISCVLAHIMAPSPRTRWSLRFPISVQKVTARSRSSLRVPLAAMWSIFRTCQHRRHPHLLRFRHGALHINMSNGAPRHAQTQTRRCCTVDLSPAPTSTRMAAPRRMSACTQTPKQARARAAPIPLCMAQSTSATQMITAMQLARCVSSHVRRMCTCSGDEGRAARMDTTLCTRAMRRHLAMPSQAARH